MHEETEPASWDDAASVGKESDSIPNGRECPWRFNDELVLTSSVEEVHAQPSLTFRLRVQSDISLGLMTVKFPGDVAGVATADLLRHVLPICNPVQSHDWFRWASSVQMVSLKDGHGQEVGQAGRHESVKIDSFL